jgi:hypothetical protein
MKIYKLYDIIGYTYDMSICFEEDRQNATQMMDDSYTCDSGYLE